MQKKEYSHKRSLKYSRWHRQDELNGCYHIDLDWIEWRSPQGIVAFVETSNFDINGKYSQHEILKFKQFQLKVYGELSTRTGKPAYYVFYNAEMSEFWVYQIFLWGYRFLDQMNESKYKNFLKSLGD